MSHRFARLAVGLVAASLFLFSGGWSTGLWGPDGHKIVGQIAYDNLSEKTKAEVDKLLDGDSLAGIANWADDILFQADPRDETKTWHYADMNKGPGHYNSARDCPSTGCVVSAIADSITTLAKTDAPKIQRQEALRFLVHFVGDIHQPLHAGRKADLGGNLIKVKLYGSVYKLHAVWDSGMIRQRGLSWPKYVTELEGRIVPEQKKAWQGVTDPAEWLNESHQIAEDHAYRTSTGAEVANNTTLDDNYYKDNIGIVEEQITKAGLRLAATLNAIYDPPGPVVVADDPAAPTVLVVKFIGSRKSEVYHLPGCKDADKIDPHNLVEYTSAPPGKRLHKGCPRK